MLWVAWWYLGPSRRVEWFAGGGELERSCDEVGDTSVEKAWRGGGFCGNDHDYRSRQCILLCGIGCFFALSCAACIDDHIASKRVAAMSTSDNLDLTTSQSPITNCSFT